MKASELPEVMAAINEIELAQRRIGLALLGRTVRVLTSWNGQQFARSKPSQQGKQLVVREVYVGHSGRISLQLVDDLCSIWAEEVEVID